MTRGELKNIIKECLMEMNISGYSLTTAEVSLTEEFNFSSILESIEVELIQEKVNIKQLFNKIKEFIVNLIKFLKDKLLKILEKCKSIKSKKVVKNSEEYYEVRVIYFVYNNREYDMNDIDSVLDEFKNDMGLNNDLLELAEYAIPPIEPDKMNNAWDSFCNKYGSFGQNIKDIIIRERMENIKKSKLQSINNDFSNAKRTLIKNINELVNLCNTYLLAFKKFNETEDEAYDRIANNNDTSVQSKIIKRVINTLNNTANYFNTVATNFIKIATSEPFSQD